MKCAPKSVFLCISVQATLPRNSYTKDTQHPPEAVVKAALACLLGSIAPAVLAYTWLCCSFTSFITIPKCFQENQMAPIAGNLCIIKKKNLTYDYRGHETLRHITVPKVRLVYMQDHPA